jgi:hypothetical protein
LPTHARTAVKPAAGLLGATAQARSGFILTRFVVRSVDAAVGRPESPARRQPASHRVCFGDLDDP